MDTGKLKNNTTYYDGYEGEGEVVLTLIDSPNYNLHIWDGYFEDIFGNPCLSGNAWRGFTMDYQESRNAFSQNDSPVFVKPDDYIYDLYLYRGKTFTYEETTSCLDILIDFFEHARMIQSDVNILVS
jgi:hypothetical protein